MIPRSLYKLQVLSNESDSTPFINRKNPTVLRPFYPYPNMDLINEWVICLESLLNSVFSPSGSESVLLEAYMYQLIHSFLKEEDEESFMKILSKIRDNMYSAVSVQPEIVIMS